MQDPDWEELEEFPNYAVSSHGHVVNMKTDRDLKPSRNQQGHVKVSLYRDKQLLTRSVALLVAQTFVERPSIHFDTPVHLDGDYSNCFADNLMWRPRWYAIKYHKQFVYEAFAEDARPFPLLELKSGERYESVRDACVKNGLYCFDVVKSYTEETFTPLTFQEFRILE